MLSLAKLSWAKLSGGTAAGAQLGEPPGASSIARLFTHLSKNPSRQGLGKEKLNNRNSGILLEYMTEGGRKDYVGFGL